MSATKKGFSDKEMQKQLGLKRYEPVWAMMHKLRKEKGKRDDWVDFLTQKGIGTGVHYPIPLYNQPIYKKLGIEGSAPDAELAANHVISLPVHPSLTQEDLDLVIDAVKQASDSFN